MAYFEIPDDDEPREVRQAAYDMLNGIKLTVEQLDEGYAVFHDFHDAPTRKDFQERRMAAVRDYCKREGLLPADVAAQAIVVRYRPIMSAWADGVDPRTEFPDTYHEYATGPIDLYEFGLEPGHEE